MECKVAHIALALALVAMCYAQSDIGDFGGMIGQSTTVSCAIIDNGQNPTPFKGCNNATLMTFGLIPGAATQGITYTFQVQGSAVQGPGADYDATPTETPGGYSDTQCLQQPPNVCSVAGLSSDGDTQQVRMTLNITRAVSTYRLDDTGINGPFLYVYRNCVAPIDQPQTDDMVDKCGVRFSQDLKSNYVKCPGTDGSTKYFGYSDTLGPYYTLCAADCAQHIKAVEARTGRPCHDSKFYVKNQYVQGALGTQGEQWVDAQGNPFDPTVVFDDFPVPNTMCPCALTQTVISGQTYSPLYSCRSGSCAGTCGTALLCDDPMSLGVCTNTAQNHRCLKCQPTKAPPANFGPNCIYPDLDRRLTCVRTTGGTGEADALESSTICPHGGNYVVGPGNIAQSGGPELRDFFFERDLLARQCNCDGYWVERMYWTAPICMAYRVRNPQIPEYTVTATIENMATGETHVLEVGQGLDTDGQSLPRLDGTKNFLLTLINDDKPQDNLGSEIHGIIVICSGEKLVENGQDGSCDGRPTAAIRPSPTPDGRTNPWTSQPNGGAGKVPLPQYVFPNATQRAANNATWWYFVGTQRSGTVGRGLNQWGWAPNGLGDVTGGNTICGGLQGTGVPGFDTTTNGDVTVTPSYVAQAFAKYIVDNDPAASADNGVVNIPRFMPPGFDPTNPNMWVQDRKLYFEDPALVGRLVVRVGLAVNTEVIEQYTSTGGGHLEPFTEDIESTGSRQNCLLQPQYGYGTLWVRIVNDGTRSNSYTLRLNCTPGIEPLGTAQQDLTYGVQPGETAGLPVSLTVAVTTAVFLDPTNAACTITLAPTAYGTLVLDTTTEKCAFSRIFTTIGPLGSGLLQNVSTGGLFGNLTGPVKSDFCDMFPVICDFFLDENDATGTSQMIVMMLTLVGIMIIIAYCGSKCGQVALSEAALNLERAKMYEGYEKSIPDMQLASDEEIQAQKRRAQYDFAEQKRKLEELKSNANSQAVRDALASFSTASLAQNISPDTLTQLAAQYAPANTGNGGGSTSAATGEIASAVSELSPTSLL